MTVQSAREVVDRYFTAMSRKEFDAMRPLLHDDVTFHGVFGTTNGAEEYIGGLRGMMASMERVERKVLFAEGENVCQIYDLVLAEPAVKVPVAQWLTVREGRIASLRVYFDPRPLLPPS